MDLFGGGAEAFAKEREHVSSFVCHNCKQPIGEGMTVYMCSDAAYCSAPCRRLGRRSPASDEPSALPRSQGPFERPPSSHTLSAWSTTRASDDCSSDAASGQGGVASAAAAVLGWLVGTGLRKFVSATRGVELLERPHGSSARLPRGPEDCMSFTGSRMSLGLSNGSAN